jgi:hypothetical protein
MDLIIIIFQERHEYSGRTGFVPWIPAFADDGVFGLSAIGPH